MIKNKKGIQLEVPETEEIIKQKIFVVRGQKVMLDEDLAELYGVLTKNFNKAVKRNISRFPPDFMFQLTREELQNLRFQIGTSSSEYGGRRYLPYVFTDFGVAMLSSVLNSERAIQMNILIIRIFIKIKELILSNKDLEIRVGEIEKKQEEQSLLLVDVHLAVRQLIKEPIKPKGKMGFQNK